MSRSSSFDFGIAGTLAFAVFGALLDVPFDTFNFLADEPYCLLAEGSDSAADDLFFDRLLAFLEETRLLVESFLFVGFFWVMKRGGFFCVGSDRFFRFLCECDPIEDEEDAPATLDGNAKLEKSIPPAAASAASTAYY